jgi:hypothetical protein
MVLDRALCVAEMLEMRRTASEEDYRAPRCERSGPGAVSQVSGDRSHIPLLDRRSPKTPAPHRGFLFDGRLSVGDGEAGADR